jgi:hypothetical protein
MRTCNAGVCGMAFQPTGTVVGPQTAGDCHRNQCDGAGGLETVVDDTDVPTDSTTCLSATCMGGVPSHTPAPTGTDCGGGQQCDGAGLCVGCITANDCPGSDTECGVRTCNAGTCGFNFVAAGTPVSAQTAGDCHRNQCDGSGNVVSAVDDSDTPADDGNQCTLDLCVGGVPSHPASAAGATCNQDGGLFCNGGGACVQCNAATDCPGSDTACGMRTCNAGVCGFDFVSAGTPVGAQTTGDCRRNQCDGSGNVVSAIDDSDLPVDGLQCTLDVCTDGVPSNPPATAGTTCSQGGGAFCDGSGLCVQCLGANDCPGSDTECGVRTCTAGVCGMSHTAAGTPVAAQTAGDCRRDVCDGAGSVVTEPDNNDLPADDGNQCTQDVCIGGMPSHPPVSAGLTCTQDGGAMCNGAGACVQCVGASDCSSHVCTGGVCQTASCTDGVNNGDETDVDCGGACGPCANGAGCVAPSDCTSGLCTANVCTAPVVTPSCTDGEHNGDETDVDCGGPCGPCANGASCVAPSDCESGVCTANVCTAPVSTSSCTDGEMNGDESDVDCGGSCGPCELDQVCRVATDCGSQICNASRRCEPLLYVLRVGNGITAPGSNTERVYLERVYRSGLLLAPLAVPATASGSNRPLTIRGTSTAEGGLHTSADGRFVTFAGYDTPTNGSATGTSRVVGRVDADGTVDTSTVLPSAVGNAVRSAVSTNGTNIWVSGDGTAANGGVWYTTFGSTGGVQVSSTNSNTRWLGIFGDQLYSTTATKLSAVGSGLPTASGAVATDLPGIAAGTSFYGIASFIVGGQRIIYLADDSATSGAGGIQRWTFNGSAWTREYTLKSGLTVGVRGLAGYVAGGKVVLFATTNETTQNRLVTVTDNGSSSFFATVATAPTNTVYRGVALAPYHR